MQPTTNIIALGYAASHYGKTVKNNRPFLQDKVNLVRSMLWKDQAARATMFKSEGCAEIRRYRDYCRTARRTYIGFTLPDYVESVQRIEIGGHQVSITDERIQGRCCDSRCARAEILEARFPLSWDIHHANLAPLIIQAVDAEDANKKAGIEYVTPNGKLIREDVLLATDGTKTSRGVTKVNSLTFPERCGFIRVLDANGNILDEFHPSVISPNKMRVRICGACNGSLVKWYGTSEPMPVRFDTDRVEFSNEAEWKNLFMAVDLHFNTGKNRSEVFSYQTAVAATKESLAAELKARQRVPLTKIRPAPQRQINKTLRRLFS